MSINYYVAVGVVDVFYRTVVNIGVDGVSKWPRKRVLVSIVQYIVGKNQLHLQMDALFIFWVMNCLRMGSWEYSHSHQYTTISIGLNSTISIALIHPLLGLILYSARARKETGNMTTADRILAQPELLRLLDHRVIALGKLTVRPWKPTKL